MEFFQKMEFYKSELNVNHESNPRGKVYLGVLISIIVLLVISSMIVAAIVIINPDIVNLSGKNLAPRQGITLEEALFNELSANLPSIQWISSNNNNNNNNNQYSDLNDHYHLDDDDELLFEESKNLNVISIKPSDQPSRTDLNQQPQPQNHTLNNIHTNPPFSTTTTTTTTISRNFQSQVTTLISNISLLYSIESQGYKLSPSKRYLLIWTSKRKLFRHTFTAKYFLYDIKNDLISLLSTNRVTGGSVEQRVQQNSYEPLDSANQFLNHNQDGGDGDDDDEKHTRFQLVDWYTGALSGEDGRAGNNLEQRDALVLIQNNDIFILDHVSSEDKLQEKNSRNWPLRITSSGKADEIFNGIPDWLYEEEILSSSQAFQVSPDGSYLAYMSFNDSQVDFISFSMFGSGDYNSPTRLKRLRYPKAGRVNPTVEVYIVNLVEARQKVVENIKLVLPDDLSSRQHYITRLKWLTNYKLSIGWLNRNQNESQTLICSPRHHSTSSTSPEWSCEKNLLVTTSFGWLDMLDDLYRLDDEHYLGLLPKDEGPEVGSFKHIAKISINQSNNYTFLTKGRKEVVRIDGVDRINQMVYYTSTVVNEPGQRQLFSVSSNERRFSNHYDDDHCITCSHYPDECLYNYVRMSPSTRHYIFECGGPGVPRMELRRTPRAEPDKKQSHKGEGGQQQKQQFPVKLETASSAFDYTDSSSAAAASERGNFKTAANERGKASKTFDAETNSASPTTSSSSSSLLWTIEDNQALKDKLNYFKAMPLTLRLKVPIPSTNYSADVLMLLPPQLEGSNLVPTSNSLFHMRSSSSPSTTGSNVNDDQSSASSPSSPSGGVNPQRQEGQARTKRDEPPSHAHVKRSADADETEQSSTMKSKQSTTANHQQQGSYFTADSIGEYVRQLAPDQQYPMVVDVYAGPGSQKVDYQFNIDLGYYLASSRRTIYVMIDGRGSGFQGTKRLYELYHRLGSVEIQDQIEVAAYLTRNYPFIDSSKVGIWGWSYGGYAAAMALTQSNARAFYEFQARINNLQQGQRSFQSNNHNHDHNNTSPQTRFPIENYPMKLNKAISSVLPPLKGVFECALSVAPVTDWTFYDTAYTERYMSSPYLNEEYDRVAPGDHRQAGTGGFLNSHQILVPNNNNNENKPSDVDKSRWVPLNQTADLSHRSHIQHSSPLLNTIMRAASSRLRFLDINERYRLSSLLEHVDHIDRKRFLLIHGTSDDNVHFQQSVMLMKRLIQRNILYESRLYPDQDHSIADKASKLHLGSTLTNFFAECFDMTY